MSPGRRILNGAAGLVLGVLLVIWLVRLSSGTGVEKPGVKQATSALTGQEATPASISSDNTSTPELNESGTAVFPDAVAKFNATTDLKREQFKKTFKGTMLSGVGTVTEIEKCGMLDHSERWGRECWKVVLDNDVANDTARVAVYYGIKGKDTVAEYKKGQQVTFKDCRANSIKDWGLWSTATCDIP